MAKPDNRDLITGEETETEAEIFESLGYMANRQDTLPQVFGKASKQGTSLNDPAHSITPPNLGNDITTTHLPKRSVSDFLIQFFFQEVNWIYEMICSVTFLDKYYSWWSQPHHNTEEDVQFSILILRLCLSSLQALPHPNHPTEGIINVPLAVLENDLYGKASKLDAHRPRIPCLIRVQHLFFHICYLKNNAEIKGSWFALSDAAKEAHELGLHLHDINDNLSEFESEIRRRVFWSLYVWDRFMSTFLGRWPLIPENYCYVELPRDTLQTVATHSYQLTPFTDRLLHIQTTRLMTAIVSAPNWKVDNTCPESVRRQAKYFQENIVDRLPPAFMLESPDTTWDAALPSMAKKREHLNVNIFAIFASLHRTFIDPYGSKQVKTTSQFELAVSHQITLADSCSKTISSLICLHRLMGGGAQRAFFIPMTLIEASAILGMCILSMRHLTEGTQYYSVTGRAHWDQHTQQRLYSSFHDALILLNILTPRSKIAQKGIKVLQSLKTKVESRIEAEKNSHDSHINSGHLNSLLISDRAISDDKQRRDGSPIFVPESTLNQLSGFEMNECSDTYRIPSDRTGNSELEWAAFATSHDQSWFFNDDLFSSNIEQDIR
ncbi:fungal-specific transcription factor domain-containing protein [Xylogone sp. PMI_703]|nr:fungal-specific transcription factor domain-containing protein [Xylogone sp. PMI_703]